MSEDTSTKVCTKCETEKELNTKNFIWKRTYWEGVCRECQNEARRKRASEKRGLEYKPEKILPKKETVYKIDTTPKPDYKIERNYNMLSQEEIKLLKSLSSRYDEIIKILDNKIQSEKSSIDINILGVKSDRTKQTYTIMDNLIPKIEEYCKDKRLSKSDFINIAIIQALKE